MYIEKWNEAVLLLGSNMGDRLKMFSTAIDQMQQSNIKIIQLSGIYETAAWGMEDQPSFLNQVLKIETLMNANELLHTLLFIENEMGRLRTQKWEQRIIDLDILFFNESIINENNLKIPHPHLHERMFTLIPLNELIPDFNHPVFNQSINQLLMACNDHKMVSLFQ